MDIPRLPGHPGFPGRVPDVGPGHRPRPRHRADGDSGDQPEHGPYYGLPTGRRQPPSPSADRTYVRLWKKPPSVVGDWVEVRCFVPAGQAGPVERAIRQATFPGTRVEKRSVVLEPLSGDFVSHGSTWKPVP